MSFPLPALRSSFTSSASSSASAVAGPSRISIAGFSSSSTNLASKRKLIAKRRKAANLQLQSSKIQTPESIDPVLGRVHYRQPNQRSISSLEGQTTSTVPKSENQWEDSKLSKILLNYDEIAYSPPPNYGNGERPKYLVPGISKEDEYLLFGALPHISTELKYSTQQGQGQNGGDVENEQHKQSEMLMRILDLRNSSKSSINFLNRQRVIDDFGGGKDTGSSRVQELSYMNNALRISSYPSPFPYHEPYPYLPHKANHPSPLAALLTAKIHNLLSHITQNPKDTSNKRSLRLMTQQRARHLKYFKNTNSKESYDTLLGELGLEKGAVEGELRFSF